MTILLFVLSAIFLLLAIHPFVTYPLSLLVLRLWPSTPRTVPPAPMGRGPLRFAVCVCAYNEEAIIAKKIRNLLALRDSEPGMEILVYVDAASDRTAEILDGYRDRIYLHVATERHGKTHGMNLLVAQAKAPVVVFTDANVMLDMEALHKLRPYFDDPTVGCVCGNLIYTNGAESVTAASGSLYWRLEEGIKKLEGLTGSIMGADGSMFAIRRSLHRPPPDHIIDDMYVSFMILCEGYRIVQASDVRAYEASVSSPAEEFRRKVRIACQAFNVHRLLWPRLRQLDGQTRYKYVSHKLLRWFTIYSLSLSLVFGVAALLTAGMQLAVLALAVVMLLVFALGRKAAIKPFSQIVDILGALAGAGIGVWRSLRGERYQTWTPAASIRKS
jgi:cellulose synthase/poly-beta-1,6-N-acetylglucosamine synthase-like glycosyltransferase